MASYHYLLAAAVLAVAVFGGQSTTCPTYGVNESLFFYDMPLSCTASFDCWTEFCFAVNGTLTATCTPFGNVSVATIQQAAARRVTCALKAALASVTSTDASCKKWGQSLTALYSLYYADNTSTNVTDACNADMCRLLTAGNATLAPQVNYTSVCAVNVTAVGNPCRYACPDSTCAANLASCGCTANAVVGTVSTNANLNVDSLLLSSALQVAASASYGVLSGTCSNFSFTSSLKYVWSVTNSSGAVVLTVNGSTLNVPANTLKAAGSYTATVTATGLLSTQVSTTAIQLTYIVLDPVVRVSAPSSATTVRSYTLTATVANPVSVSSYNWSCVSQTVNASCPSLNISSNTSWSIPAGSAAGTFVYTYTYTTVDKSVSASVTVVVVSTDIPVVTFTAGKLSGGIGGASQYSVFYKTQMIAVSGFTVAFGSAYTRSWKVNGVAVSGTADSLTVSASSLSVTTLSAVTSDDYVFNTITLTVTSSLNANISASANVSVIVLDAFTSTLTVNKLGDNAATSAASLTDSLSFTATLTPALTTANAPFGGALTTAIVYYQPGATTATSLYTTASGSAQVGVAPIIVNGTATGTTVTFGVQVTLAGVVVASANGTFVVTLANLTAAASAVAASLDVISDPNEAVSALGNIGALLGSGSGSGSGSGPSTSTLVNSGVTMLATTIVVGVQLSSTQALSVATNVGALLSLSANKTDASAQVTIVMIVVLTGPSFNLDVASAVGSTIGQMSPQAGAEVANQMMNVITGPLLAGQNVSVSLGSAGSMSAASSTGAALAGLAVSDAASGVTVTLPLTFLSELTGLSADATYGAVTLALAVSPFEGVGNDTTAITGGIVRQTITSGTDTVAVTGLVTAIVIRMPAGSSGTSCVYRNEVDNTWATDGVEAVIVDGVVECHTKHLTAFATASSSAAAVALSVLVVALAAMLQLIAA